MAKRPTAWKPGQSGNPAGKPPGALALMKLIAPEMPKLVDMLLNEAILFGDIAAARVLIERCVPALRPESVAAAIPGLAEAVTPSAKADAIIAAVGRGDISASVATELLNALASAMKVLEVDELKRRIEALEQGDVLT